MTQWWSLFSRKKRKDECCTCCTCVLLCESKLIVSASRKPFPGCSTNDAGELDFAEAFVKGRSDAEFQKCEVGPCCSTHSRPASVTCPSPHRSRTTPLLSRESHRWSCERARQLLARRGKTRSLAPRAQVTGSYPGGMNAYQEIPWQVFHSADVMKGRPESFFETLKVVLVRVATKEPYRLDFERVVVVDGTTGSIDAPEVQWAGSKEETVDPVLRIIKDRFVIVDSSQKPDPERVVKGYFLNKRPEDVVQGMPEIDEVDAMNQGLDEPDVPTVDLV